MKKLLTCFLICCTTLFAGVFLVSCSEPSSYRISLGQVDELVSVQLKNMPDEELVEMDANNGWTVSNDAQIKVEISATTMGVVMDDVVVNVNGREKKVVKSSYDMFDRSSLTYCWFTLPMVQLKSNIQISVAGARIKNSTFTFDINEGFEEDEALSKKLQSTYICVDDSNKYVQLYQYMLGNNKSYTKQYSAVADNSNPYRTFKMQFKDGDKVVNDLYSFANTSIFTVSSSTVSAPVGNIFADGDHLVVNLGQLRGEDNYTIKVNFENLTLQEYEFSYPQEQDAFEISIDKETVNYEEGGATLTFTKKNKDSYDYSNLVIRIGDITLEITGSPTDDTITFTIPEKLSPASAGLGTYPRGVLEITVDGIEPVAAE